MLNPYSSFDCQFEFSQDIRAYGEHISIGCVLVLFSRVSLKKILIGRNFHYVDEEINIRRHNEVELLSQINGALKLGLLLLYGHVSCISVLGLLLQSAKTHRA